MVYCLYIGCDFKNSPFEDRVDYYAEQGQTFEQAKNSVGKENGWNTLEDNLTDEKKTDIRK